MDIATYQEITNIIREQVGSFADQHGQLTQAITQLNHDYTALTNEVTLIRANLDWIMRFFWLMMGAAITNFIASLFYIITQYGKKRDRDK